MHHLFVGQALRLGGATHVTQASSKTTRSLELSRTILHQGMHHLHVGQALRLGGATHVAVEPPGPWVVEHHIPAEHLACKERELVHVVALVQQMF